MIQNLESNYDSFEIFFRGFTNSLTNSTTNKDLPVRIFEQGRFCFNQGSSLYIPCQEVFNDKTLYPEIQKNYEAIFLVAGTPITSMIASIKNTVAFWNNSKPSLIVKIVEAWKKNKDIIANAAILRAVIISKDKISSGELYALFKQLEISSTGSLLSSESVAMKLLIQHRSFPKDPLRNAQDFYIREKKIGKLSKQFFSTEELFRLIFSKVDQQGYGAYYDILKQKRSVENAPDVVNSIYYENRYRDVKALLLTCKRMQATVLKFMGVERLESSVFKQKIFGQLRYSNYFWMDNKMMLGIDNGCQIGQSGIRFIFTNITIPKAIVNELDEYALSKPLFPLKKLIDDNFPKFLPTNFKILNALEEKRIFDESKYLKEKMRQICLDPILRDHSVQCSNDSSGMQKDLITTTLEHPHRTKYYNLQLMFQQFNGNCLSNIKALNKAILNKASVDPYKGKIYNFALLSAMDVCLLMMQEEFFLPSFVEGFECLPKPGVMGFTALTQENDKSAGRTDWAPDNPEQLNLYNTVIIVDTSDSNNAVSVCANQSEKHGQKKCLIACDSKFKFTFAELTSNGLEIHLKTVPNEQDIDNEAWSDFMKRMMGLFKSGNEDLRVRAFSSKKLAMDLNICIGIMNRCIGEFNARPDNPPCIVQSHRPQLAHIKENNKENPK